MNANAFQENGWKPRRWLSAIFLVFTAQVVLIFCLGERPRVLPGPTGNAFTWRIAVLHGAKSWLCKIPPCFCCRIEMVFQDRPG
jgi:hypothetical protein